MSFLPILRKFRLFILVPYVPMLNLATGVSKMFKIHNFVGQVNKLPSCQKFAKLYVGINRSVNSNVFEFTFVRCERRSLCMCMHNFIFMSVAIPNGFEPKLVTSRQCRNQHSYIIRYDFITRYTSKYFPVLRKPFS